MYIHSLIYEDQSTGWKLELIEFKPLTLLVGISGVGKTQILKALLKLKEISEGKSLNGIKWKIRFFTSAGHDCTWFGEFDNQGFIPEFFNNPFDDDEKDKPLIKTERLLVDNEPVIERTKDGIVFNGEKTVKLSQQESVIFLLKEENQIKDVYESFKKILFDDNAGNDSIFGILGFDDEIESKSKKYKSLKAIRNSDENISTKLRLLYKNQKKSFHEIAAAFIDIFPNIEDVKIEPISTGQKRLPFFIRDYPLIQIREKNVSNWVNQLKMSSGMIRALMHIAELHLCADDTVILIDEFENSLGINCINQITRSIVDSERNLQFIITSHHPYIINDVGFEHWKIVTRKGGVVRAIDAEQFGIGKSKHQAFTQLANLPAYSDGIDH